MTGQDLLQLTDAQLGELLAHEGLSVVLLTAVWDGNGIILQSLLQVLRGQYRNVNFCVADFEQCPRMAKLFNMARPPGLLFVHNGELVERVVGTTNIGELEDRINKYA